MVFYMNAQKHTQWKLQSRDPTLKSNISYNLYDAVYKNTKQLLLSSL